MKRKKIGELSDEIIRGIYRNDLESLQQWRSHDIIDSLDKDGRSAVFHAVLIGSVDIIKDLFEADPNLNLKDNKGWTPLHYAAQNYLINIAELLIDNGADIEIKDDYGNTPLWRATFSSQGKGEMIKLLLHRGANPNTANDSGVSPYELANTIANYDVKQFFPHPLSVSSQKI
ncbi:MAG: ankyrin repeat domain-containing protein [Mucilaginibacter sp.]|nr:ankyrin repeat domain-containing protein [Mucilaginibacter sp.]